MKPQHPMTKSPRAVVQEALRLAREALPAYSSKYSRKDFTQHQLFAVLALKASSRPTTAGSRSSWPTSPSSGTTPG